MRMGNACLLLLLLLVLGSSDPALSGDVYMSCDEFEQHMYMDASDAFCTVTGFVVTHSQNIVVKNFLPGNMVKFMKFYDSTLLSVPFHLFETFTHLKTLDVSYTSILELTRNTFSAASNLSYLNLSYNNLTSVQTSVFIGANALMRLDLSYNRIAQLSENAFCGLHNLNKLQLTGNRLTDLHKDIFKDNEYLESVSFEGNLLTFIQPEVFSRMRRIKEVNLSNNKLIRIHPDTFTEAASLESLLLATNSLDAFQLTNKNIVHQLHLDYNHLTNLTINATRFVRANFNNISSIHMHQALQLETLELRGNRLASIANITNLTALLHLDLSYNPIGSLSVSTFDQLKRLRNLYLRSNGVRELQFGMFSKQKYLEILDLSFNNLTHLNLDLFVPYLTNLKQFFVDGNSLSEVQGNRSFAQAFPLLQKLGISRNRFNCSYLHHLLIPPYLAETVTLHIEPDNSTDETPHIRDVSCISLSSVNPASKQGAIQEEPMQSLHKQLELLRAHSHNLELHLHFIKFFFYVMGAVILISLVAVITLHWRKAQRSGFYNRSSIVFHSNATMHA
ncbi:insulin-like growth factor-binding protein complex acid labile subunit [Drosophila hydei]|uniref:Insulin-like growth factor-binding protein complex acid labile subunit n=1 Tax=Drosophila hydei TaxID=7224 RepID=A0A6J1MGN4_DROHY|nr:insulin-like growth factor-binding protein complex acid labile subunit [Drosophila hydei]